MKTHYFTLRPAPFDAIVSGAKTIESRLHDEKRSTVELGDEIIFTDCEDAARQVSVRVVGLLRYANFQEMFTRNDPKKFGKLTTEDLVAQIEKYYTYEQQEKYGVMGIEFEIMPRFHIDHTVDKV